MKRLWSLVLIVGVLAGCNSLSDTEESGAFECDVYCNMMEDNCDKVFNGNQELCLDICDQYASRPVTGENGELVPLGNQVPPDDSLECRIYHLDTALLDANANNAHCEEAAPSGGATCVRPEIAPECAKLCHNIVYGCDLFLEDYRNCERDCDDEIGRIRDSAEFQCRTMVAQAARDAKNDDRDNLQQTACQKIQSFTTGGQPCLSGDILPEVNAETDGT